MCITDERYSRLGKTTRFPKVFVLRDGRLYTARCENVSAIWEPVAGNWRLLSTDRDLPIGLAVDKHGYLIRDSKEHKPFHRRRSFQAFVGYKTAEKFAVVMANDWGMNFVVYAVKYAVVFSVIQLLAIFGPIFTQYRFGWSRQALRVGLTGNTSVYHRTRRRGV